MRIVAWFALLAGCAAPLPEGFPAPLTREGGCGDVTFFAADAADTTVLVFEAAGLVEAAHAAGQMTTTAFGLPSPDADVRVEVGRDVSACGASDGVPVVHGVWRAAAGVARATIAPGDSVLDAAGTLVLEDLVLERGGAEFDVERFEIADVIVGQPGA